MKYLFVLGAALLLFACSTEAQEGEGNGTAINKVVSPEEFKEKMNLENVQIIDVRTPEEYAGGKIGNAQNINFFDSDFKKQLSKVDKNRPTLVYCAKGGRSAKAAKIMTEQGFTEVYDLDGGYGAW